MKTVSIVPPNVPQLNDNANNQSCAKKSLVMGSAAAIGLGLATVYYVPIINSLKSIVEYSISCISSNTHVSCTIGAMIFAKLTKIPLPLITMAIAIALSLSYMVNAYINDILIIVVEHLKIILFEISRIVNDIISRAFSDAVWVTLPFLGFPYNLLGPFLYLFGFPLPEWMMPLQSLLGK